MEWRMAVNRAVATPHGPAFPVACLSQDNETFLQILRRWLPRYELGAHQKGTAGQIGLAGRPRFEVAAKIPGTLIAPAPGRVWQHGTRKDHCPPLPHGLEKHRVKSDERKPHTRLRLPVLDHKISRSLAVLGLLKLLEGLQNLATICLRKPCTSRRGHSAQRLCVSFVVIGLVEGAEPRGDHRYQRHSQGRGEMRTHLGQLLF